MQYTDITSRALTYLLRSPHLHIDMTEAIYRGLAELLYAQPDGVLLRLRAPWNGRTFLYECSAATPERSAALLEQLVPNVPSTWVPAKPANWSSTQAPYICPARMR